MGFAAFLRSSIPRFIGRSISPASSASTAALAAWPIVYGKLIISDVRPVILDADGKSSEEHKLLVRKEGKNCLIWSKSQQRLEILSVGDNQTLVIGFKEHLLE